MHVVTRCHNPRGMLIFIHIFLEDVRRLTYYTNLVNVKNVIRTHEKEEVVHSLLTLRVLPGALMPQLRIKLMEVNKHRLKGVNSLPGGNRSFS